MRAKSSDIFKVLWQKLKSDLITWKKNQLISQGLNPLVNLTPVHEGQGQHYSMRRFNLGIRFQKDGKIKVENWPNMNFEGNTVAKESNENLWCSNRACTRNREVTLPDLSIHTDITGIMNFVLKYAAIQSKKEVHQKKKIQNWHTNIIKELKR